MIQQRMPEAYVMVNPADAATLGVNAGSLVEFSCAGQTLRLPVRLSETLTQARLVCRSACRDPADLGGC